MSKLLKIETKPAEDSNKTTLTPEQIKDCISDAQATKTVWIEIDPVYHFTYKEENENAKQ